MRRRIYKEALSEVDNRGCTRPGPKAKDRVSLITGPQSKCLSIMSLVLKLLARLSTVFLASAARPALGQCEGGDGDDDRLETSFNNLRGSRAPLESLTAAARRCSTSMGCSDHVGYCWTDRINIDAAWTAISGRLPAGPESLALLLYAGHDVMVTAAGKVPKSDFTVLYRHSQAAQQSLDTVLERVWGEVSRVNMQRDIWHPPPL